jgi:hypothetical protein
MLVTPGTSMQAQSMAVAFRVLEFRKAKARWFAGAQLILKMSSSESPQNGGMPLSNMYRMTPRLHRSASWL